MSPILQRIDGLTLLPASAPQMVRQAWGVPFIGDADSVLVATLEEMYYDATLKPSADAKYHYHTYFIQSSGSGKSRAW